MRLTRAGVFRWDDVVYTLADEALYRPDMGDQADYRDWRTYQMSDHRPMWVELATDFSDEYLADLAAKA